MSHVVIIGGGVVGLSLAYELSCRNQKVTLVDNGTLGGKSSWAGAGIIPPTNLATAIHPLEQLEAISTQVHCEWAARLFRETGIDNEWTKSGGLYLARTSGERAALNGLKLYWWEREIELELLTSADIHRRFGVLGATSIVDAIFVPAEYQLRNPWHLQALQRACQNRNVQIYENVQSLQIRGDQTQFESVEINGELIHADCYCVAAGAWSQQLLQPLGIQILTTPVRGQVVLFRLDRPLFQPIINEGSRYLVPRRDGHIIAGATVEEVGFNEATESDDIDALIQWATSLVLQCNPHTRLKEWAGLRPGSFDGLPYLGFLAENSNILIATGHFKSGLHLSSGTAVVIADLIEKKMPPIDLAPFRPNRAALAGQIS
jgi:glycine oxidase